MITVEIDGKATHYVYLADPEQRRDQKYMVKQAIASMEEVCEMKGLAVSQTVTSTSSRFRLS
jgi:hypothetical protein